MGKMSRFAAVMLVIGMSCFSVQAQDEPGRAYYDFGVFAYEDGDYGDAETNLKKALDMNPDNPFYHHFLGKTYIKTERYDDARVHLNRARELNPDLPELGYDIAFLNYKTGDYGAAANGFSRVAEDDGSNVLAAYYAGISLFKEEKYRKALTYLNRASEKSPSIKANCDYYAGVCYQKLRDVEKAKERFAYVRDHGSESLSAHAVQWLDAIERYKAVTRDFSIYFKLGAQYDDNVTLEPIDLDLYADESDMAAETFFSFRKKFINDDKYTVGTGFSFYQTWHDDLSEYNLTATLLNVFAKYRVSALTFGLEYLPGFYWVDNESYLFRNRLKPNVSWRIGANLMTRLSYTYSNNEYFDDHDRDGDAHETFLDAYYSLGDNLGHLFGGAGYEANCASHSDYDYGQMTAKLGASLNLPWEFVLGVTGKYYEKKYDNEDSIYGVERDDSKYFGSISLSRKLYYDWLGWIAEYSYTKNDSNINAYEYERNVYTMSMTVKY